VPPRAATRSPSGDRARLRLSRQPTRRGGRPPREDRLPHAGARAPHERPNRRPGADRSPRRLELSLLHHPLVGTPRGIAVQSAGRWRRPDVAANSRAGVARPAPASVHWKRCRPKLLCVSRCPPMRSPRLSAPPTPTPRRSPSLSSGFAGGCGAPAGSLGSVESARSCRRRSTSSRANVERSKRRAPREFSDDCRQLLASQRRRRLCGKEQALLPELFPALGQRDVSRQNLLLCRASISVGETGLNLRPPGPPAG
jgi:hypothetical protein